MKQSEITKEVLNNTYLFAYQLIETWKIHQQSSNQNRELGTAIASNNGFIIISCATAFLLCQEHFRILNGH